MLAGNLLLPVGLDDFATFNKVCSLAVYVCADLQTKKTQQELAALRFAESKLTYAAELVQQHGSSFPPELHFLGSNSSSKSADAGEAIRAEHAFDSPEVLTQFIAEMRIKAEDLAATAVVLIAPKSAIAFPQVCN